MRTVTFSDARVALEHGVGVHIGVSADSTDGSYMAEAFYEEDEYDSNTTITSVRTRMCQLKIGQYDELRALGAIEDGLLARIHFGPIAPVTPSAERRIARAPSARTAVRNSSQKKTVIAKQ
jgi:hypothetical protein